VPSALQHRDFRLFYFGLVVAGMGTQFTTVAMAWQVYELTDSALQIGLLGLARAVPQMGLLLFGGLLADAVERRRLLFAAHCVQCAVSAALAALTMMGAISPLHLYVAAALLALLTAVETPARQALVPNIVPRESLASALALNTTMRHMGTIVGPSLAGLVLAFSGSAWCYTVDALALLPLLAVLPMIKTQTQVVFRAGAFSLRALREGLDFVWTHPVMLTFMLLDFGVTFLGNTRALMPVYARDILAVGAPGLGLLYSAESCGSVIAATVLSVRGTATRAGLWVLIGVAIHGVCISAFALSPWFWLSLPLLVGVGISNTIGAVMRNTINQLSTPDELRGRVSSANSVFTTGGPQLGQFRAGTVAELWGAPVAALTGGVATLLLVAALSAVPSVRGFRLRFGAGAVAAR